MTQIVRKEPTKIQLYKGVLKQTPKCERGYSGARLPHLELWT